MAKEYGTKAKKASKVVKFYRGGGETPLQVEQNDFTLGEVVSLSIGEKIDGKVIFSRQYDREFDLDLVNDLQSDLDSGVIVSASIWG